MKYFLYGIIAICCPFVVAAQDATGLWKGTLYNDSTHQTLDYEVFISKEKGKYTGYSHTWFLINDKKYYGIKKIKVHTAKDGKIILQDEALLENNYPADATDKNVYQLDVLELATVGTEATLNGEFITRRTRQYHELTGHINLTKMSPLAQSSLAAFLQKNGFGNNLTAVK